MNSRAALAVSAGLNVGLLLTTAYYFLRPDPPRPLPVRLIRTNTVVKVAARTLTVSEPSPPISLDWHSLESDDYRVFIKNLREVQCPDETIKDILIADLTKLFAKKFREQASLLNLQRPRHFWKLPGPDGQKNEISIDSLRSQLFKEQRDLVRDLLGVDLAQERARTHLEWHDTGEAELRQFLPEAKASEVAEIREKHRAAMDRFRDSTANRDWTEEEKRKWKYLLSEQEKELAAVLSPKERTQYDLWFSETSETLRKELSAFQPNEKEFLALYAMKKSLEEALDKLSTVPGRALRGNPDDTHTPAREKAKKDYELQLANVLGPERFEQFERAQNPQFRELLEFTQSIEAEADTAPKLFEIRQAVEEETDRIYSDPFLNAEDRERTLLMMREETEKAILSTLGSDGVKSLNKRFPNWIHPATSAAGPSARSETQTKNSGKVQGQNGGVGP